MGKRGPKKTPTAILQRRGSRQVESRTGEPDPPRERPDTPDWLDADGQNCWDALVPLLEQMGVLRRIDGKALARYCSMWVRWRKCQEFLTKNGETYMLKDADGKPRCVMQWPQVSIAHKLATLLLRIEQEFGMTPASRPNLHVESSLDDDDLFLDSIVLPPPQNENSHGG